MTDKIPSERGSEKNHDRITDKNHDKSAKHDKSDKSDRHDRQDRAGDKPEKTERNHVFTITIGKDREGSVVLTFSDTGPGIPKEIEHQPLSIVRHQRQEQGGTGLGLAIVRRVAEEHGGTRHGVLIEPKARAFKLKLPQTAGSVRLFVPSRVPQCSVCRVRAACALRRSLSARCGRVQRFRDRIRTERDARSEGSAYDLPPWFEADDVPIPTWVRSA